MSRLPTALTGAVFFCLALTGTARAQNAESELDRKIAERLATQQATTDLTDKRCALGQADATEIVVCAPRDREKDRYPGREQLESVQSTRDGLPRAPNFAKPSCKGQPGCLSFGKVPPPMVFIDVKALPQAPAGSDADLIAKGEMKQP